MGRGWRQPTDSKSQMTFLECHIHDSVELAEGPWSNQSQCSETDGDAADRDLPIKILQQQSSKQQEIVFQNITHRGLSESRCLQMSLRGCCKSAVEVNLACSANQQPLVLQTSNRIHWFKTIYQLASSDSPSIQNDLPGPGI